MRRYLVAGLHVTLLHLFCLLSVPAAGQPAPEALLSDLDSYPHAESIALSHKDVIDYELGLGSLKKVRGVWKFSESERHSGQLTRHTWQIIDGFTAEEVMKNLTARVAKLDAQELLFSCDGRSCGKSNQWANRVFGQRLLYGREDRQRYRIYKLVDDAEYRLVIYAAMRTADRQYLQVDLLKLSAKAP